jgi:CheY-like chemotaxis protein
MTDTTTVGDGPSSPGDFRTTDAMRPRGVLVVDDWEPLRRIACSWLRRTGFAVWAASGREAADLYRKHRTAIDVVLLDVRVPGHDGPETPAILRELDASVRCCFMSGDTGKYSEERLREMGAVAVFQKPFRMSELTEQLVRVVAAPSTAREL